MKCERWIDQHDTSIGQAKNLSPQQESNPWPRKECLPHFWKVMDLIPIGDSDFFLCPTFVACWSIHLSYFINELKIHHLYSLINIKYTGINSPYLSLKSRYKTAEIKNFITSIFGSREIHVDWIVPHGCTTAQPTSRNVISCVLKAFACRSIPWIDPWLKYKQQSIDTSIDTWSTSWLKVSLESSNF